MSKGTLDRVPPQNIDAERAVLGAMMLVSDAKAPLAIADCLRILKAEHFYRESHRKVFTAIKYLVTDNQEVDLLTVSSELEKMGELEKVGGAPYLDEMIGSCPSAANAAHYAVQVKQESDRRQLIYVTAELGTLAYDETEDVDELVSGAIDRLLAVKIDTLQEKVSFKLRLKEVFKDMQERALDPNNILGMPFGIKDIDAKIGGLLGGDMCVVAARPGVGKSTFVQNVAQYLCDDKNYRSLVAIFSLEMKDKQIMARILASEAKVPFSRFRSSDFEESEWPKLTVAAGRMTEWKCEIEDKAGITPMDVRSEIQRLIMTKGKPDLVIVDYLQLMRPTTPTGRRVDDVTQVSQDLKEMAMFFDIPFLVVSQLSRNPEARPDHRPMLSDLRESGSIEQDADIVCFLYREDYYDREASKGGPCEFIIAKQRMGPTGTVKVHFDIVSARFQQAHVGNTGRQTFRSDRD